MLREPADGVVRHHPVGRRVDDVDRVARTVRNVDPRQIPLYGRTQPARPIGRIDVIRRQRRRHAGQRAGAAAPGRRRRRPGRRRPGRGFGRRAAAGRTRRLTGGLRRAAAPPGQQRRHQHRRSHERAGTAPHADTPSSVDTVTGVRPAYPDRPGCRAAAGRDGYRCGCRARSRRPGCAERVGSWGGPGVECPGGVGWAPSGDPADVVLTPGVRVGERHPAATASSPTVSSPRRSRPTAGSIGAPGGAARRRNGMAFPPYRFPACHRFT